MRRDKHWSFFFKLEHFRPLFWTIYLFSFFLHVSKKFFLTNLPIIIIPKKDGLRTILRTIRLVQWVHSLIFLVKGVLFNFTFWIIVWCLDLYTNFSFSVLMSSVFLYLYSLIKFQYFAITHTTVFNQGGRKNQAKTKSRQGRFSLWRW